MTDTTLTATFDRQDRSYYPGQTVTITGFAPQLSVCSNGWPMSIDTLFTQNGIPTNVSSGNSACFNSATNIYQGEIINTSNSNNPLIDTMNAEWCGQMNVPTNAQTKVITDGSTLTDGNWLEWMGPVKAPGWGCSTNGPATTIFIAANQSALQNLAVSKGSGICNQGEEDVYSYSFTVPYSATVGQDQTVGIRMSTDNADTYDATGAMIYHVVAPPASTCALPWGGYIGNGQSVTAYQSAQVTSPATPVSEVRTCNNGTLSGIGYTNQNCTVVGSSGSPTASLLGSASSSGPFSSIVNILNGQHAFLQWSSSGAASCSAIGTAFSLPGGSTAGTLDLGPLSSSGAYSVSCSGSGTGTSNGTGGSQTVYPTNTTTYTGTFTGPKGTNVCSATVNVSSGTANLTTPSIAQMSPIATYTSASSVSATLPSIPAAGDTLVAMVETSNNTVTAPTGWTVQDNETGFSGFAALTGVVGKNGLTAAKTYTFDTGACGTAQIFDVSGAGKTIITSTDSSNSGPSYPRMLQVPISNGLLLTGWGGWEVNSANAWVSIADSLPGGQTSSVLGYLLNSPISASCGGGRFAYRSSDITSEPFNAAQPFTNTAQVTINPVLDTGYNTSGQLIWLSPVISTPPTCAITASPNSINSGQPSLLTWTSMNAASGTITAVIGNGTSGSQIVFPNGNTTYTGTFVGDSGTANCSVTVLVGGSSGTVAPACTLTASPGSITPGQAATLTWSSTNATSGTIPNLQTSAPAISAPVTITVAPSSDSLTATPNRVALGSATILSAYATSTSVCYLYANGTPIKTWNATGGIVNVPSYTSPPVQTQTTFQLLCNGQSNPNWYSTSTQLVNVTSSNFQDF
ncbi:MAG: hypothetical protein WAN50_02715 [Minisyncoccia bacterium]